MLNSFVFFFDSPAKTLNRVMMYEYFGYPKDFLFEYQKKVAAVTRADVLRVMRRTHQPGQSQHRGGGESQGFRQAAERRPARWRQIDLSIPPSASKELNAETRSHSSMLCAAACAAAETPAGRQGQARLSTTPSRRWAATSSSQMQDRVETGRAYSFYRDNLSGLSIAKIYTRYITVDPTKSAHELGVRERQAFGKNEDSAVVLREDGGANITYRGPKALPRKTSSATAKPPCTTSFTSCGSACTKPGMEFESRGSDVVDRVPVEIVDVIDAQNFVVTRVFSPDHQAAREAIFLAPGSEDQGSRRRSHAL